MTIALKPVVSSFIAAIGYEPVSRTLAVHFAKGSVIHFDDVAPEVAEAFDKAESPGRFFATEIRGKYHSTEIAVTEHEGATPD